LPRQQSPALSSVRHGVDPIAHYVKVQPKIVNEPGIAAERSGRGKIDALE
jgi:hypothetical protein